MAVIVQSNNRILPNNQRNADVAALAVERLADTAAGRMQSAFRVQGIEACIYNRLTSGEICSCQGKHKHLNHRLGKDGKADMGTINEIVNGGSFAIDGFGIQTDTAESYIAPGTKDYPPPLSEHIELPGDTDIPDAEGLRSLDDIVGDFDAVAFGIADSACPVCFGTGFVGGFSLYNGFRKVITCYNTALPPEAELLIEKTPWSAKTKYFNIKTILPKHIVDIDAFRVLNLDKPVRAKLFIDGMPLSQAVIRRACDGRAHTITAIGDRVFEFTHLELQFNLSRESSYMEVPKLRKGDSLALVDATDPFQVLLSPNIPRIDRLDIITESMWGKALMIQSNTWLNTKERKMLGWECDARVVQPQEIFNLLPRRERIATKAVTMPPIAGNYNNRP